MSCVAANRFVQRHSKQWRLLQQRVACAVRKGSRGIFLPRSLTLRYDSPGCRAHSSVWQLSVSLSQCVCVVLSSVCYSVSVQSNTKLLFYCIITPWKILFYKEKVVSLLEASPLVACAVCCHCLCLSTSSLNLKLNSCRDESQVVLFVFSNVLLCLFYVVFKISEHYQYK